MKDLSEFDLPLMPRGIEKLLWKLREKSVYLDYGRDVIINMLSKYVSDIDRGTVKILDLGVGEGEDLKNIKGHFSSRRLSLYGIDSHEAHVRKAKEMGISVYCLNIEKEKLPFENKFFNIIIANQIIEHTKEIFFIFSEISRVLSYGGIVIVGFPNLAALHNRILLLLGRQPICSRMLGPHVRSITKGAFRAFITADGYFEILEVQGSNFYPFPPSIAKQLSRISPTLSISLYFCCRRTEKQGRFIDVLKTRYYETPYYLGEER